MLRVMYGFFINICSTADFFCSFNGSFAANSANNFFDSFCTLGTLSDPNPNNQLLQSSFEMPLLLLLLFSIITLTAK